MKHIEPSEINIINFLTGEMTSEEANQFRQQINENPLLNTQVEEMSRVQKQLGIWKEEDIQIPSFKYKDALYKNHRVENSSRQKKIHLPIWLRYVAVFLGFGLLIHLLGFKVNQNGNTLMFSFGEPNIERMDAKILDNLVANAIEKYSKEEKTHLTELKNQMKSDLSTLATAVDNISAKQEANLAKLESSFNRKMNGQYVRLESFIKSVEDDQRQDLEDSFTGLVEYIENKRDKDQHKIQNAFSEIATAINNQQYQTNALLTSISDEDPGLKSY